MAYENESGRKLQSWRNAISGDIIMGERIKEAFQVNFEQAGHIEVCIACTHPLLLPAAVEKYRKLAHSEPQNLFYRGFLIYALKKMKDWHAVVAECRALIRIAKRRGVQACAHFRIAMALEKLGFADEAASEMAAAARLLPKSKPFRDAVYYSGSKASAI